MSDPTLLARIASISAVHGVDVSALAPVLSVVAQFDRGAAEVAMDRVFARVSVSDGWPVGDGEQRLWAAHEELDRFGPAFPAQRRFVPSLEAAFAAPAVRYEITSVPETRTAGFAVEIRGSVALEDIVDALRGGSMASRAPLVELRAVLAGLSELSPCGVRDRCGPPALHLWSVWFSLPDDRDTGAALVARCASRVRLGPLQRELAESLHRVLAPQRGASLAFTICPDRLLPYLTLEYRGLTPQEAARVLFVVDPEARGGERLGALFGASAAKDVASLTIRWGGDYPGIKIAVRPGARDG
jgi:hypothetical protein